MRIALTVLALALAAPLSACAVTSTGEPTVVTSFYPLEFVTREIAGDDMAAVLDFDADGLLLGVELPLSRLHPDLLGIAGQIG